VHHGADADAADRMQVLAVLALYILCQLCVGVLDAGPDILQRISPDAVCQAVLPVMGTGRDGRMILPY